MAGAKLDTIDLPLKNRGWFTARFTEIGKASDESERRRASDKIGNWTNPGLAPSTTISEISRASRKCCAVRVSAWIRRPSSRP